MAVGQYYIHCYAANVLILNVDQLTVYYRPNCQRLSRPNCKQDNIISYQADVFLTVLSVHTGSRLLI